MVLSLVLLVCAICLPINKNPSPLHLCLGCVYTPEHDPRRLRVWEITKTQRMWVCSADVPEKPDNPYSTCSIKITRERSDVPLCSFPWPGRQVLLLAFSCLPTCCKCLVTLQGKTANGLTLGGSLALAAGYSKNLSRNPYPSLLGAASG